MSKLKTKKMKFFSSYMKENLWLEDMAKEGWFLKNIVWGTIFTFEKGKPKHILYEVYRFNLPARPTLEEIRHKDVFLDMAKELGWQEVTHDEGLTHYFCKEYVEGEINEMCNDEDSRFQRAEKFSDYIHAWGQKLIFWITILNLLNIIIRMLHPVIDLSSLNWFTVFVHIYTVFCCIYALWMWGVAKMLKKELSMTKQEWRSYRDKSRYKCVKKLILTNRGLNRFLRKEEAAGWILAGAGSLKYSFERKEGKDQVYTLDSRWLTNRRLEQRNKNCINDPKDYLGMNNDWQLQSVKDAEERGWTFVCALDARAVIYKGDAGVVEPLNDAKYDNSLRTVSLLGAYGVTLFISGLIGGILGSFMGYFNVP